MKGCAMSAESDQVKGKFKQVAGIVTGNTDLESEGETDRRVGEAKEKIETAKDKVEEVIETAKHKVEEAIETAKDKIEEVIDKAKDALHRN
jgi:uncharacterized protein YjbJ (UPF0337 family)